jgi:myo-inositol-1(or 4)-monophosphatase
MVHPDLLSAVQRTGAELLRRFELREMQIKKKGSGTGAVTMVTDADLFSEAQLVNAIRSCYPDDTLMGEEGSKHKGKSGSVWHIDPIDGTSNFVHGIPTWGISLGRATKGLPDIGVIYLPALGQLYVAEKGRGATCNSQSIHVSERKLKDALYWAAGYGKGKAHFSETLALSVRVTKMIDSSAFELCHIASGQSEIYELHNVPHDVVAGIVIVTEAGGKVTDRQGKPYTTASKTVVATNGVVHAAVLKLLKA